jgi:hypothetical protein
LGFHPNIGGDNFLAVARSATTNRTGISVRSQHDGSLKWEKFKGQKDVKVVGLSTEFVTVVWYTVNQNYYTSKKTIEIFQLSNGQRKMTTKIAMM